MFLSGLLLSSVPGGFGGEFADSVPRNPAAGFSKVFGFGGVNFGIDRFPEEKWKGDELWTSRPLFVQIMTIRPGPYGTSFQLTYALVGRSESNPSGWVTLVGGVLVGPRSNPSGWVTLGFWMGYSLFS